MISMFGSRDDAQRVRALRALRAKALEAVAPAEDESVVVKELSCNEPGCPPVETVIAWLRRERPPRLVKIPKRAVEVTDDELRAALNTVTRGPEPALGEAGAFTPR